MQEDQKETTAVERNAYREAMSRLGAAVNIITTTTPEGAVGFTASAVCSVTDDPPTLLVCMNRASRSSPAFHASRVLCVNVLAHEHQELSGPFAGVGQLPMSERFALAKWLRLVTGSPVLEDAAASFDCTIDQIVEVGTHSVFFCGVKAIRLGPITPALIYHGRAYHRI
jgi:flavin reductase